MSDPYSDTPSAYNISVQLAQVEAKLDMLIKSVEKEQLLVTENAKDLEERVSILEKRMAQVVVIAFTASLILPIGINLLVEGIRMVPTHSPSKHHGFSK